MIERNESLTAETNALRELYAALNRGDIDAVVRCFDPDIAWIEPEHYGGGGTRRGRETMRAHLAWARGTWAEGGCEPERFVAAGDKVVVSIHVHVRRKDQSEWLDARHAAVWTFRDGQAVEQRIFDDEQEALAWAGVVRTHSRTDRK